MNRICSGGILYIIVFKFAAATHQLEEIMIKLLLLIVAVLLGNPNSTGAFGYSGGGGSGGWLSGNIISNLAVSQGADGNEANDVFDDMIRRSFSDLFMIAKSEEPCLLYVCGSLQSELITEIAEAAIKYKEFDDKADKEFWDSIQKGGLLLLAGYGAWLGWMNRYRPR